MKDQLTDIVVVLDRSGSMASVLDDTIGGFNTFLEEQKGGEGRARLTLTQFDNEYEIVHERRQVGEVPPLDRSTFVPRGSTALLDAIGRTISSVRGFVASEPSWERPWKVVFVIITDGEENSSQEFDRKQVFEMIERQEREDGWEFLYLGANQDAIQEARAIGIGPDRAASWKKAKALHRVYSEKLAKLRAMGYGSVSFDDEDRRRLELEDDEKVDPSKLN